VDEGAAGEAFRWIVSVLRSVDARFQVVGGLAARAYGGNRALVDLDLYVEAGRFMDAVTAASEFLIWGPAHHRDESWDLTFAKLEWKGIRIELAVAEGARYFDRRNGEWVDQGIDFSRAEMREVLGVVVPVIPRDDLRAYKEGLDREVDRLDLREIGTSP
jgi:hypothetical protein